MKVLLVEDDATWAGSVELMLRGEGHDCETLDLGEAAVERARSEAYDAILLDVMLPDIDGYEVLERLRAAGVETPTLLQSGLVDRENGDNARAFGVEEFIVKPFDKAELIDCLERVDSAGRPKTFVTREERFKSFKSAEMIAEGTPNQCMVLNISPGGAAIRLPRHMRQAPAAFDLKLQTGRTRPCEVCWRVHDKIGVKFTDA